jgi:hypothetical protein
MCCGDYVGIESVEIGNEEMVGELTEPKALEILRETM